ncbi:MAG: preprotein translocase subunit SecD [Methanohalobium sp.]|uniref:preprotein translocase subunit SecD n=1 Tax=Methanohalobium sp. TaxID=2837493 RepID=UPI003977FFA5
MSNEEENGGLLRNRRVQIFIIALIASLIAIQPIYVPGEGAQSNLNYGLDLEGGSWLQLQLQGAIAQVDGDPSEMVKEVVESSTGAEIRISDVNIPSDDSESGTVTFTTDTDLTQSQINILNIGEPTITRDEEKTTVQIQPSKQKLITAYLSDSLGSEVVPISRQDATEYEIRTSVSQQELQELMEKVDGSIVTDPDGSTIYSQGVTEDTRELTKETLSEKLNALGLKDIPVRSAGDNYILIDFAGVDLSTAKEIAQQPGKFEINIVTEGNRTRHVLYGEDIESVDVPSLQNQQWNVPFTLSESGARSLQKAAKETGAINNPSQHHLKMHLDDQEIYSAPLSPSAADKLRDSLIYSWQASIGGGEEGKDEAKQLQIHLRAGALPVNVEIIGSGHVDASLGEQFKLLAVIAGVFVLIGVAGTVYNRYREKRILIPMVGISFSEVVMILGFSAAIGWQLDLPSIAGIIAVIGTGIDHLVIITDEVLYEGKLPPTKIYLSRITKAFGIIIGAAATTIIAMSPLMVLGFGALRGFALTTIVGVLIGVFIARPVYGIVIKEVLKDTTTDGIEQ